MLDNYWVGDHNVSNGFALLLIKSTKINVSNMESFSGGMATQVRAPAEAEE